MEEGRLLFGNTGLHVPSRLFLELSHTFGSVSTSPSALFLYYSVCVCFLLFIGIALFNRLKILQHYTTCPPCATLRFCHHTQGLGWNSNSGCACRSFNWGCCQLLMTTPWDIEKCFGRKQVTLEFYVVSCCWVLGPRTLQQCEQLPQFYLETFNIWIFLFTYQSPRSWSVHACLKVAL